MTTKDCIKIADLVAERIKDILNPQPSPENDYVSTEEAAEILGVSVTYLRTIRNDFNFIKRGTAKQARLLFPRSELLTKKIKKFNYPQRNKQ